ncbi:MAG: PEGA domain-containing protein [Polyangiales bacterium]
MRWLAFVSAAVLAAVTGSAARAQHAPPVSDASARSNALRWLVLPVRIDHAGASPVEVLHTEAEALRYELSVRGESVWRADRASERFEVAGSVPAPEVSQSDIDRWVERSRAAVRYLARADYKAARRELKAAQRLADRAAAELNREAARAQQVLDTCLFMVRAYVETKNDAEARRQARECRQLVPRVEPTAFRHTPEVRELLAEVDAEMAAEAPGTLQVTSEPAECLVRINGVEFGRTPLSGIELPVGTYRLQVECEEEQRGRIHRVTITSGANAFAFDGALERAVHTRPVLYLQYPSRAAWKERMDHATKVARILGGGNALVVTGVGEQEIRVDLAAEGYAPASAWLAQRDGALDADDVRRAIDALFEGRSVDFTGPHPLARASWAVVREPPEPEVTAVTAAVTDSEPERPSGVPRPRDQRIAGWTLFGLGLAGIGTSIGLHVWRGDLGDRFIASPASLSAAQRWNDARVGVWTTAAFGGAAASAAMPLLLPDYERPPWWAWTLGVAGLGLTGYAIYEGVTLTSCPEPFLADEPAVRSCVTRGQEAGRLSLSLAGAAPLLSVPLVYLFRPLRATPSVSVNRRGAVVQVGKAF